MLPAAVVTSLEPIQAPGRCSVSPTNREPGPPGPPVPVSVTQADGQTSHAEVSYDISWLPSNRANLASLQVPIPAGFTRVSPKAPS